MESPRLLLDHLSLMQEVAVVELTLEALQVQVVLVVAVQVRLEMVLTELQVLPTQVVAVEDQ
jgi:hypothetical protein